MARYDDKAKCSKCGNNGVTTTYDPANDRIGRCCRKCGHRWTEEPLDQDGGTLLSEEVIARLQKQDTDKPTVKES